MANVTVKTCDACKKTIEPVKTPIMFDLFPVDLCDPCEDTTTVANARIMAASMALPPDDTSRNV